MDAIVAAVIGVVGPVLIVAGRRQLKRWRRWRRLRERRWDHQRIMAESLLAVTLRLQEVERELAEIRRRLWPW